MRRRVVITGTGIISSLALSGAEHFDALCAGACGIGEIAAFEVGDFPVKYAAEVKGFRGNKFLKNRKSMKIMARDIQLAVAAASLAATDAGIYDGVDDPTRLGVSMGAGLLPTELDELGAAVSVSLDDAGQFDLKKYGRDGLANLAPLWLLKYLPNMLNSHIAIEYDARGPNNCITVGNASGLLAVGEAMRVIERGQADIMMAGSAESKVHPLSFVRLFLNGKLSTDSTLAERGPMPFGPSRSGLAVGEGGAVLVLEEESHARARGARIYAEVAGFGSSCGGQLREEVSSDATGATAAMKAALGDAGLDAAAIDAVLADASGLEEDAAEAKAIAEIFGEGQAVFCGRAASGHTMAASGALDACVACMALESGRLPGTFGADGSGEPPVALTSETVERDYGAFLVNAFTFGGQTGSLALKKCT